MGTVDQNLDSFLARMEAMLEGKLDEKLKNIATKDDIASVHESIKAVKKENDELRNEINQLKESQKRLIKKIEDLDKASRRANIVVSGIEGGDIRDIQTEVSTLFQNVLKTQVQVNGIKKLNRSGKMCTVELESIKAVNEVLSKSKLLHTSGVYLQRDYTADECNQRFNLRRLKKILSKKRDVKTQIKGTNLIIDNKIFKWQSEGTVTTKLEKDATFLNNMLNELREKSIKAVVLEYKENNEDQ